MEPKITHRVAKSPRISGRFLAEYMNASERRRRTIVRACKYRAIARVIQHNQARSAISRSYYDPSYGKPELLDRVEQLRTAIASDPFERDVNDHNADYIEAFCGAMEGLQPNDGMVLFPPGGNVAIALEGVLVSPELSFRVERVTKTNKRRLGAGVLRYSKSGPLKAEEAIWQASFIQGYLASSATDEDAEPEGKICLVVDVFAGEVFSAPGDAVTRFNDMQAACASIAERWDNIAPPPKAVL